MEAGKPTEAGQPAEASDAPTLEDDENARATICLDFTKNKCNRGAACKFTHDVEVIARINAREEGVCYDWQRGMCTRGKLCRFSHDPEKLAKEEAKQASKQQVTGISSACANATCVDRVWDLLYLEKTAAQYACKKNHPVCNTVNTLFCGHRSWT